MSSSLFTLILFSFLFAAKSFALHCLCFAQASHPWPSAEVDLPRRADLPAPAATDFLYTLALMNFWIHYRSIRRIDGPASVVPPPTRYGLWFLPPAGRGLTYLFTYLCTYLLAYLLNYLLTCYLLTYWLTYLITYFYSLPDLPPPPPHPFDTIGGEGGAGVS